MSYASFLQLLLRHGSLHTIGTNFHRERAQALSELGKFLPPAYRPLSYSKPPAPYRIFFSEIVTAARTQAGHLALSADGPAYIRIPKCANTSLSLALFTHRFGRLPSLSPVQINALTDSWLERKVPATLNQPLFTVVRNPFHRLVSVYRDFFEQPGSYPYGNYLLGILPRTLSFHEFVSRISAIPVPFQDQHFRPQTEFLKPYHTHRVQIFKLEEPDALHSFLSQWNITMPLQNASANPYAYRTYYTPVLEKAVQKLYTSDFEVFNYDQYVNAGNIS
jgi:hypothetical protein